MLTIWDRLIFLLDETWVSLRRNTWMSLAAVSTSAVALALFGGFTAVAWSLHQVTSAWPDRFEMRVLMRNEATAKQIQDTDNRIRAIADVYSIQHQTREQNWEAVKVKYQPVVGDLQDLENPLPDTFTFKVKNLERSDVIAYAVKRMKGVETVQYLKEEQRAALRITQFVRVTGGAVSGALLLAAVMLIFNTIRLAVVARSREIRVMQLVGAGPLTIRVPFVLEAAIHGAVGGALAACVLWFAALPVVDLVNQLPGVLVTLRPQDFLGALGALTAGGVLLGALCGMAAVRRFVRV
jgi:cell division transport system permease protein